LSPAYLFLLNLVSSHEGPLFLACQFFFFFFFCWLAEFGLETPFLTVSCTGRFATGRSFRSSFPRNQNKAEGYPITRAFYSRCAASFPFPGLVVYPGFGPKRSLGSARLFFVLASPPFFFATLFPTSLFVFWRDLPNFKITFPLSRDPQLPSRVPFRRPRVSLEESASNSVSIPLLLLDVLSCPFFLRNGKKGNDLPTLLKLGAHQMTAFSLPPPQPSDPHKQCMRQLCMLFSSVKGDKPSSRPLFKPGPQAPPRAITRKGLLFSRFPWIPPDSRRVWRRRTPRWCHCASLV